MVITKDKFAAFHYTLKDSDGNKLDSSLEAITTESTEAEETTNTAGNWWEPAETSETTEEAAE